MKHRKTSNGRIGAETFVRAWKKGGTIADVAERLGTKVPGVHQRAVRLRSLGVKLPKLERRSGGGSIDVAALNAILRA